MSFLSANLLLNVIGLAFKQKEVAIYNETREVLTGGFMNGTSVLNCRVVEDSRLCEHPTESGVMITDHKVINPVEIDIRLSVPSIGYNAIYNELENLFMQSTELRIKTKAGWFYNMVLQGLPHEESPESYDRIVFDLHFSEIIKITPQFVKLELANVKNITDSDTKKLGENVTNNNAKRKSIIKQGLDAFKGMF